MPEGAGNAAGFESGAFVRSKKDASVSGIVTEAPPMKTGGDMLFLQVRLGTGELRYISVESLELVPAQAETADQLFAKGRFADPDWLRRTLTRIRVTGGLADMFYSMEASDTDFYAHQFKPVLKLLNSPSESLLIADEVGLGKTIEAGLIWTELRARFDARRLLVVCPKTLCQKWRMELDRRFGVDAKIVNAAELLELMQERSATNQGFAAISWMQALRPPRDWEEADYRTDGGLSRKPQVKLARYLRDAAAYAPLFDLLVIDEAHYMRNPETQTHKVGSALQPVSSHRVFLSATPIHLKNDDLHSLLKLLDPDTFQRADAFHEILATNQPLIEARDRVMSSAATALDIRGLIDKAMAEPLLRGNNQLALIKEALGGRLDARRRSEIAWQLEQASLLANVVTRTRRRDVEAFKVVRDPAAPHLDMSEAERKFYDAATAEVSRHAMQMKVSDRFLLSVPQRLLSSSAAAASRYWAAASAGSLADLDEDEELATETNQADDHRPLRDRLSDLARELNLTTELEANDTKYECLKTVLSGVKKADGAAKLIVFSSFRITLDYLARRLKKDGVKAVLMHGSVKESRDELLRRFREESDVDLLLSSEVGSEGIDLQFCWAMVNYDLPWNPMRLEQRIGRIDRLGQKAKRIRITNLVHDGTIDNEIYRRLYLRLDLCRQALGEFEAVLGEPIRELTAILMDPNLTEDQKAQQLEQTAQALENQKLHHEKLEAEAGSLVAHGDVILQKIRDAHDMNRWLTDRDILTFVSDALNRHYPGCTIRALHASDGRYDIALTAEARSDFARFAEGRGIGRATRLLTGSQSTKYKFVSSAVRSRELETENISSLHPLVRFASHKDRDEAVREQTAAVATVVPASVIPRNPPVAGLYVVGLAKWSAGAERGAGLHLGYAGCRVGDGDPIDANMAEAILHAAASEGEVLINAGTHPSLDAASFRLQEVVAPTLRREFDVFITRFRAEADDRAQLQLRTLANHVERQRNQLSQIADNHRLHGRESLAAATEGRLRELLAKSTRRRADIEAARAVNPGFSEVSYLMVQVDER